MTGLVVAVLFVLALFGLPLFLILGTGAMAGYVASGNVLELYFASFYRQVAGNPVFLAIPLFTLAGYILAESRAPERLVRISRALLGWLPGGLAMVALVACAVFTAFTGASGVTIVALGGLLLPALLKDGYPKKFTMGLLTSSGSRGILFPPSLPLIVYAMIAGMTLQNVDVAAMRRAEVRNPAAVVDSAAVPGDSNAGGRGAVNVDDAVDRALAEADGADVGAAKKGSIDDAIDKALAEEGGTDPVKGEGTAVGAGEAVADDSGKVAPVPSKDPVGDAVDRALAETDDSGKPADAGKPSDASGKPADPVDSAIDKALADEDSAGSDGPNHSAADKVAASDVPPAGASARTANPAQPAGSDSAGSEADCEEVMQVTVDRLFVAGALPGLLSLLMVAGYAAWFGTKHKVPRTKFSIREVLAATKEIAWEIPVPFIVVVGILGGFFTAVDAAAFAAAYIFVVEVFIYKDVPVRKLPVIFRESMVLVGGILLILMSAQALTNFFIDVEVPQKLFAAVKDTITSPLTFLLILNLFLLVVGMLMDIFSAIMVVVPIIAPVAVFYGINPVHLGIVVLTNLEIGFNTPPVGVNLFVGSLAFRRPVIELARAIVPYLTISLVSLVLITYWPDLSLFLVRFFNVK